MKRRSVNKLAKIITAINGDHINKEKLKERMTKLSEEELNTCNKLFRKVGLHQFGLISKKKKVKTTKRAKKNGK